MVAFRKTWSVVNSPATLFIFENILFSLIAYHLYIFTNNFLSPYKLSYKVINTLLNYSLLLKIYARFLFLKM